jgi:hypothetical protein
MEAFVTKGLNYPRMTVVTDSLQMRMNLLATGRFFRLRHCGFLPNAQN